MVAKIIEKINAESLKSDVPAFKIGDGVKVYVKIKEGDKERLQAFIGTVIASPVHSEEYVLSADWNRP